MWSIPRRLKQTWTRWSLWKRSLLLCVGICIGVQLAFVASMWRELQFRQRIQANGRFIVGPSLLPAGFEAQLSRWIGTEKAKLFAPIVELQCNDPTASDLADIAWLTHLQALSLEGGTPGSASLKRIGALPQLTTLELLDVDLENQSLTGLANCSKLCRIKLRGKVTPETLEPLKHCESLGELYLERRGHFEINYRESPYTRSHLAVIAKIPHLKRLIIKSGEIDDTDLVGLAFARELETLTVSELQLHTDAINILGRLPRLRQLVIEPFDPRSVDLICSPRPLKGFPALKAFSITNSRITPAFIAGLAKLPKLEALSFDGCRVNKVVTELGDLPKLKLLDLASTDVESRPYRKIGHFNAYGSTGLFIDERSHQHPDQSTPPTIDREDYFDQPEWPELRVHYGPGFW